MHLHTSSAQKKRFYTKIECFFFLLFTDYVSSFVKTFSNLIKRIYNLLSLSFYSFRSRFLNTIEIYASSSTYVYVVCELLIHAYENAIVSTLKTYFFVKPFSLMYSHNIKFKVLLTRLLTYNWYQKFSKTK